MAESGVGVPSYLNDGEQTGSESLPTFIDDLLTKTLQKLPSRLN